MQCKVEGCDRAPHYKAACLCQKHYFRVWRYGTTETTKVGKGKERYTNLNGYVWARRPGHPLAGKNGLVSEHRAVVYDDVGPGSMQCELCGCFVTWATVHIDHIDDVRDNNARENLRPTCRACNTRRGRGPEHSFAGRMAVTFNTKTMTPHEWSRQPGVQVASVTIRKRLEAGQSVEQALFGPKKRTTVMPIGVPIVAKRQTPRLAMTR